MRHAMPCLISLRCIIEIITCQKNIKRFFSRSSLRVAVGFRALLCVGFLDGIGVLGALFGGDLSTSM